jgi:hypothetical protein
MLPFQARMVDEEHEYMLWIAKDYALSNSMNESNSTSIPSSQLKLFCRRDSV